MDSTLLVERVSTKIRNKDDTPLRLEYEGWPGTHEYTPGPNLRLPTVDRSRADMPLCFLANERKESRSLTLTG